VKTISIHIFVLLYKKPLLQIILVFIARRSIEKRYCNRGDNSQRLSGLLTFSPTLRSGLEGPTQTGIHLQSTDLAMSIKQLLWWLLHLGTAWGAITL